METKMNENKEILQYAEEMLRDKACVSVDEIPISSDADYARLLSLILNYQAGVSPYLVGC